MDFYCLPYPCRFRWISMDIHGLPCYGFSIQEGKGENLTSDITVISYHERAQWAAVTTHASERRDPPQKSEPACPVLRATWCGWLWGVTSSPLMICGANGSHPWHALPSRANTTRPTALFMVVRQFSCCRSILCAFQINLASQNLSRLASKLSYHLIGIIRQVEYWLRSIDVGDSGLLVANERGKRLDLITRNSPKHLEWNSAQEKFGWFFPSNYAILSFGKCLNY